MFHNVRDDKGRFIKTSGSKLKVGKKAKTQTNPVNHIAIVLDRSSSMAGIRYDVVEQFNRQIDTIRAESIKHNIKTYVSLYTFASRVDAPLYFSRDVADVKHISQNEYIPQGMTALYDGVGRAVEDLSRVVGADDNNTSFLIIPITDGEENQSRFFSNTSFRKLIADKTATDRWSFAFLCPANQVHHIVGLGVPRGNIQPWEATSVGTQVASNITAQSLGGYYMARSSGAKSVSSFFTPDLSSVTAAKMARSLTDSSKDFLRLSVDKTGRIDEFVERTTGNSYKIGSGLYQLTKSEDVQNYKKIVVQDKATNKLYSGVDDVRNLLKLPLGGTLKVRPSSHPDYNIYVQSTAANRKLLAGTTLLLDKSLI